MQITRTPAGAREAVASVPRPLGLVPTMGALHAGHHALVARARAESRTVAASIFVNPLQFGPSEDFDRYPRSFDDDVAALREAGVDLLYAPDVATMYPAGFATAIDPGPIGALYEGVLRPGHFSGVATVCVKLFATLCPDRAYFGAKDAQQVAVLRRIVTDLNLPLELVVVPTVREPDGLALSSRNVYLDGDERAAAHVAAPRAGRNRAARCDRARPIARARSHAGAPSWRRRCAKRISTSSILRRSSRPTTFERPRSRSRAAGAATRA